MFERHFAIRDKYSGKNKSRISSAFAFRRACAVGNYLDVLGLLPYVENINETGHDSNKTALHWAGTYGHAVIFRLLEQNGASAFIADAERKTPLDYLAFTNPDGLKDREKQLRFFTSEFQEIFNLMILGFLHYNDIFKALMTCRYNYNQSIFIKIYTNVKNSLSDNVKYYLSITTYEEVINPNNLFWLSKTERRKWASERLGVPMDDAIFSQTAAQLSNPYCIIILDRYLSHETARKVYRNSSVSALISSPVGLKLFQMQILSNKFMSQLVLEPDVTWFCYMMKSGVKELLEKTISLSVVWESREELNILITKFGAPPSISEALELVTRDIHLQDPIYNPVTGDLRNDPYTYFNFH